MNTVAAAAAQSSATARVPSHRAGAAIAWTLWAYWTCLALLACPYEDTVRDIAAALDIAGGSHWPSTGPGLAFSAHLGPAWFYLLAPVAAFTSTWLGVAVFIAALSALKFPLAFRLGSALAGTRFGVMLALALLLPGWQHLQAMLPTHTSLVETTALLCLLSIREHLLEPRPRRAFIVGLTFALALHAHPTNFALLPLGLIAAWRYAPSSAFSAASVGAAALGTLLPFAPYLTAQAMAGWPDAATTSIYAGQSVGPRQLAELPALVNALLWGGPHTLIDALAPKGMRPMLFGAWSALMIATAAAFIAVWPRLAQRQRALAGNAWLAWGVTLCTLCILRDRVPWYMAYAPTLACAMLLAASWSAVASAGARIAPGVWVLAAVCAGLGVSLDVGLWRQSGRGEFLLPGGAMHDTLVGYEPTPAIPLVGGTSLPARFAAASGRFLCTHRDAVLHASYAIYVDGTAGLDQRLMCDGPRDLLIGSGTGRPLEHHWIGLPRRLWQALERQPELWIGSFGMGRPAAVSDKAATMSVSTADRYPQRDLLGPGDEIHTLELDLPAGAALVASSMLGAVAPASIDEVRADGVVQAVAAATAFVSVYDCKTCLSGPPVRWQVKFRAARGDVLDLSGLAAR